MQENRKVKIDFEDTDKKIKIEIYGKDFEINENVLSELKTDDLADEQDIDVMDKMLDDILGAGSVETLNNIRKENGYEKMGVTHELAIFMRLIEVYTESVLTPINEAEKTYNNIYNKMNRYERRNYNKGYRNNRYDRYRR